MGIVLISICVAGLLLILPLLQIILFSFLIAFIMFIPSRNLSRRTRLPYGLAVVVSFVIAVAIVIVAALVLLPELWRTAGSIKVSIQQTYAQLEHAGAKFTFRTRFRLRASPFRSRISSRSAPAHAV